MPDSRKFSRFSFAGTLLALLLTCAPARAELLWDDGADLEQRIDRTMRTVLPRRCTLPAVSVPASDAESTSLIGYNNARASGERQISYEVVVRVDRPCFQAAQRALRQRVRNRRAVISNKTASAVEAYFDADGGPTFIFRFPATAAEVRSLQ